MASPAHAAQTTSGERWPWPLIGEIATAYRNGSDPYAAGQHRGVDIAAPVGTPARAVASGTVAFSGKLPDGGNAVTVRTADGKYLISFLHLHERSVRRGADVSVGDALGSVGTTGRRSIEQAHLHLGVRMAATRKYVDPMGLLGEPIVVAPGAAPPKAEQPAQRTERAEPRSIRIVPLEVNIEGRSTSPAEARANAPLATGRKQESNADSRVSAEHRSASPTLRAPAPVEIDDASSHRSAKTREPVQLPARTIATPREVATATGERAVPIRAILLSLAALAFATLLINRRPRGAPDSAEPPAAEAAANQPPAELFELSEARVRGR